MVRLSVRGSLMTLSRVRYPLAVAVNAWFPGGARRSRQRERPAAIRVGGR